MNFADPTDPIIEKLHFLKNITVTDWDSIGRVIAQTRGRAFQTLGRVFNFLLNTQTLGRAFQRPRRML